MFLRQPLSFSWFLSLSKGSLSYMLTPTGLADLLCFSTQASNFLRKFSTWATGLRVTPTGLKVSAESYSVRPKGVLLYGTYS